MAAVAKDTDACVSPGHVSSAILANNVLFLNEGTFVTLDRSMMLVD